jgi:hypothetical protein
VRSRPRVHKEKPRRRRREEDFARTAQRPVALETVRRSGPETALLEGRLGGFPTRRGKWLLFGGWRGWYYVFERTLAETLLALRLIEARFAARETTSGPRGC